MSESISTIFMSRPWYLYVSPVKPKKVETFLALLMYALRGEGTRMARSN